MARVLAKLSGRLVPIAFGLLVCGLVLSVSRTGLFSTLELKTLDWRFKTRPAPECSNRICHVDIDDASISSLGRFASWPRARYARALKVLKELGATAVAFDVEFREPSDTKVPTEYLKHFLGEPIEQHMGNMTKSLVRRINSPDAKSPEQVTKLLQEETQSTLEKVRQDFDRQIPYNDRLLAEGLERFGAVYLAGNVSSETEIDPVLSARITEALSEDFELDALKLAGQLKVPTSVVADRLITLKERLAFDRLWRALSTGSEIKTAEDAARLLIPGYDASRESAERVIIERTLDRVRAAATVLTQSALTKPAGRWNNFPEGVDLNPPLEHFASVERGFGLSNAFPDPEDGVVRRVPTYFRWRDRLVPHLSLSFALHALGASDCQPTPGGDALLIKLDGDDSVLRVPLESNGQLLVNWAGNAVIPWTETFSHVSFGSLLELDALRRDVRDNDNYLRLWFATYMPGRMKAIQDPIESLEDKLLAGTTTEEERVELRRLLEARSHLEDELLAFLKRNLEPFEGKTPDQLDGELREPVTDMRRALRDIPEIRQLRTTLSQRADDLKDRLAGLTRNKFCIVGMTALGSTDIKSTPIDPKLPGVAVHGFVVNSLLTRSFIRRSPGWVNVVLTLLIGLLVTALAGTLPTTRAAVFSVASIVGYALVSYLLFILFSLWLALVAPVTVGFLSYATITAYRQLTEERQKRQIKHAFQHYLAPSVIEEILKDPSSLRLGGQRKEVTVFFSDIAGFTPISEKLDPQDLTALLNEYLTDMSGVILTHEGYLNKYVGDAIMAVFGAPLDQSDHAVRACRAALESQTRLAQFREKLQAEKRPPIRARIGINSGPMIVGNMGSDKLFDYTVIGDNVNVGARLESANKAFSTEIIIGEQTYKLVKDEFECRRLGLVAVKGRVQPVASYQLLALKGALPSLMVKLLPLYETGLRAYAEQDFETALKSFQDALTVMPKDGPSRAYLGRCEMLLKQEKATVWDGVFALEPD